MEVTSFFRSIFFEERRSYENWRYGPFLVVPLGCRDANSPEVLGEKLKSIGVYAETESGISPILVHGIEEQDVMSETSSFKFTEAVPSAKRVSQFYLNLPNSNVSESELYVLDDVSAARWHYAGQNDPRDPKPIFANAETVGGQIYKFSFAELPVKKAGYACLWVSMAMGTPDRMYCVHLID
jgi:hypothetical protein